MFNIQVYRYRYKSPPHPSSTAYLESPQDINHLPPPQPSALSGSLDPATHIVVRERGGVDDNHVHWVPAADVVPMVPLEAVSTAHGIVERGCWAGDRVWLRSDQPVEAGRRSCPVVNLEALRSAEVRVGDVRWRADRRGRVVEGVRRVGKGGLCENGLGEEGERRGRFARRRRPVTLIGPEYRYPFPQAAGQPEKERFRMCVVEREASDSGEESGGEGMLAIVTMEEMDELYGNVSRRLSPYPQCATHTPH